MKIQEKLTYICETCGKEYSSSDRITQCQITGRDLCENCRQCVVLVDEDSHEDDIEMKWTYVPRDIVISSYDKYKQDYTDLYKMLLQRFDKLHKELNACYLQGKLKAFIDRYYEELKG